MNSGKREAESGKRVIPLLMLAVGVAAIACSGGQTQAPAPVPPNSQLPTPNAIAGPSTLDNVYSMEQAERGRDVYAGTCRSCHTPTSHTGATFDKWWKGKHLSDLYSYVLTKMPGNDPGSLAPEQVADVVAYLLRLNAMPPGTNELYPDADSLKKFVIIKK